MHFLRKNEVQCRTLGKPRACVTVRVVKDTLVIESGSLGVLKIGAQMAPVPERVKVISDEGKGVKPSKGKQFWVSVETFDPMHAVMEAASEDFY